MAQVGYPSLFHRNLGGIGVTTLQVPNLLFSKKFNVTINKKQSFDLNINRNKSFTLKLDRN